MSDHEGAATLGACQPGTEGGRTATALMALNVHASSLANTRDGIATLKRVVQARDGASREGLVDE